MKYRQITSGERYAISALRRRGLSARSIAAELGRAHTTKKRRKRYGAYDSRGKVAGKRHLSERPAEVEDRVRIGHWEIDTVMGTAHGANSVLTLVEQATGYTVMGKPWPGNVRQTQWRAAWS